MHADFPAYKIPQPLGQFTCQHISQRPKFLHSLEESSHCQASHGPNSSTHWNNQYAHRPSTVRKPPPTGGILPQAGLPTSIIPHRAEENTPRG